MRVRGVPRPKREHWVAAAGIGGLILFWGNGSLVWGEQRIPSGLAVTIVMAVLIIIILLIFSLLYFGSIIS